MSTNPFRQIIPSNSTTFSQSPSLFEDSDGGGPRSKDLSVDTKVPPSSLDRHVSFASPPVNSTISAVSYPSSPESARSPLVSYGQPIAPFTPDYRTALQSDPFEDLAQDNREDHTLQQALQNAQDNVTSEQTVSTANQYDAVRNTLSRFASAPRAPPLPPPSTGTDATDVHPTSRQSMDVDAFKRLLLTGDSGQKLSTISALATAHSATKGMGDSGYGTDTASVSQNSILELNINDSEETRNTPDHDLGTSSHKNIPPPTPAPRRGKSVKASAPPQLGRVAIERKSSDQLEGTQLPSTSTTSKKPPTPPLARRQSHKTSSLPNEETSTSSFDNLDVSVATSKPQQPRGPPPPPLRRHGTSSEQRRVSHDLAPTAEEPENDAEPTNLISSRKSSDAPPVPPSRSWNSSDTPKRSSVGSMNPPPVPPPRRGRGSSRSSIDSFRPSLASLMGDENDNASNENLRRGSSQQEKDVSTLNSSNANSILAELADLQREVDAARRGA